MRAIRNGLYGAGIRVENSKGEASAGQEEINVVYDAALVSADEHSIIKNACKEIAWSQGKSVTAVWHAPLSDHLLQGGVGAHPRDVRRDP
jgi:glutamine synthetase